MKPISNAPKDPVARGGVESLSNPTFTEASERANIASGESLSTIFGKIKKFFSDLKTVAFSGSYNDLSDKPSIPAAQIQSDWNQTTTTAKDYIKNKPTIPTVNNATLTIQKNGTTVQTFTANASSNVTCNITMSKSDVGLGNVDNTADANKSVNYANSAGTASLVQLGDGIPLVYSENGNINFRYYTPDGVNVGYSNLRDILDRCYDSTARKIISSNGKDQMTVDDTVVATDLKMHWDSNLAIYKDGAIVWATNTSSRRFKHNIQDMTEERARKILDIRTVTFDWNDGQLITTRQNDNAGVIAEEVTPIIPDVVVFERDEENPENMIERRVEYERFTPYLIKLAQMQQTEIDTLKSELAELKTYITKISN